ncbi:MAG: hypothetical protein IT452_09535 [Planctomycetia bacterium]|nr:hypothetical protein [Planctomycetia bacterium]
MRAIAAVVVLALVAGCASEEKKPADTPRAASERDLAIDVGAEGVVILASGTQAKLRIVNTGASALSVCDDSQCMLLDPGGEIEFPVSGRMSFHVTVAGDGAGKAEAHLIGGGEKGSIRVQ